MRRLVQWLRVAAITFVSGLSVIAAPAHAIPASERAVLIDLYNSTNGAGWATRANWRNAANTDFNAVGTECTWIGVGCSAGDANVIVFGLAVNNLTGTLPATLNQLTRLRDFVVSGNAIGGAIPSLAGLSALRIFYVNGNQLTGAMPNLSESLALINFRAGNNQLTGPIPSLTGLTALADFSVEVNQLSRPLPNLSGLNQLRTFSANNNQLTGLIPNFGVLNELIVFDAHNNRLTGAIPSLAGLPLLRSIEVQNNQLSGAIPSLAGLTDLRAVRVENNQLSGALPILPSPSPLETGQSDLCENQLTISANADWDAATPGATWDIGCIAPRPQQVLTFGAAPTLLVGGSGAVSASATPTTTDTSVVYASLTPLVCSVNPASGLVNVLPAAIAGNICTISADKVGTPAINSAV